MSGERRKFLHLLLAAIFWAPRNCSFAFVLTHVAGVGKGRGKGTVEARFNACDNPPPPLLGTSNTQATLLSWRLPGVLPFHNAF